ncbi:MAG: glycerol-3-phosphate dehydrogenase subunit GlpB [Desulfobacter sp.]|nr:MAG: glycerol-3-phosphate dehydrogenase subunit GlpB [Desulfobacter sp.]
MKMDKTIRCDLLIIGAGAAGMIAGIRGASRGLDTVVAGNPSALAFSSGILDYLGVYPAGNKKILADPEKGLEGLLQDFPNHAYGLAGREKTREYFEFLKAQLDLAGLPYTRMAGGKNMTVPTAMGTLRPGFLVPETMAAGAGAMGRGAKEMVLLVAGIRGLAGFSAVQVAEGLAPLFLRTIPFEAALPGIGTGVPPQILAEKMAESGGVESFAAALLPHAPKADIIGLPAVCGIEGSGDIAASLARRLNKPVFEIPGPPPSVPGLRLKRAFEKRLADSGGRLLSNVRIKDPVFDGRRFTLKGEADPEPLRIRTAGVLLATGRFFGGGLHARRERIVEPVFHLDVAQPTGRRLWHDNRFLTPGGHAVNRSGIETDEFFRPLDERGRPVYAHLYAAGSILAHNDWARLKSGTGTALVSACKAVDAFAKAGEGIHGI